MQNEEQCEFTTSDGLKLEGLCNIILGARGCAVVLHPAPGAMGGSMRDYVVESMAHCMAELGLSTLRFNFRGTGKSEGVSSTDGPRSAWGTTEGPDVAAAIAFLKQRVASDAKVILCGYSMGTGVGLGYVVSDDVVGERAGGVDALLCVAPVPLPAISRILQPMLLLLAEHDRFFPLENYHSIEKQQATSLSILAGADHFSLPRDVIAREIKAWFRSIDIIDARQSGL